MKNSSVKYNLIVFDANKLNIYDFLLKISWILSVSSFYLFRYGETFYVHLIAPDNKIIISLCFNLVNWDDYNFNQVISHYLILFLYIKNYLDITDFSNIEGDYRFIVLNIGTKSEDSLNEVDDYLQNADYIQDEIVKVVLNYIQDDIKESEDTLKKLRNYLEKI